MLHLKIRKCNKPGIHKAKSTVSFPANTFTKKISDQKQNHEHLQHPTLNKIKYPLF